MLRTLIITGLIALAQAAAAQNLVTGEYWVDSDPGFGVAIPFDPALPTQATVVGHLFQVTSPTLTPGIHTIGYRTKDDSARWSLTNLVPIYIADSSNGIIVEVEYFWDEDPGFGQSPLDTLLVNPATDWSDTIVATVPLGIGLGNHWLFMRSRDSRGRWSLTNLVDTVLVDGTTDVEMLEAQTGVRVYPNPFAEQITVTTADANLMRIVLYDPQGKLVFDKLFTQQETIDLRSHASGVYQAFFWRDRKIIHSVTLLKQ